MLHLIKLKELFTILVKFFSAKITNSGLFLLLFSTIYAKLECLLDKAGKVCQGQILQLKLQTKKFQNIGPWPQFCKEPINEAVFTLRQKIDLSQGRLNMQYIFLCTLKRTSLAVKTNLNCIVLPKAAQADILLSGFARIFTSVNDS